MQRILSHRGVRVGLQLGLSALILWLLLRDVELDAVRSTLAAGSMGWLLAAFAVKAMGLLFHEYRLWLALPKPRPATRHVISLGLAAGVLNLALPARAGDLAAIAFMDRECKVPVPVGTAAVGVTSFLEAALFAFFLLGVFGMGAAHWADLFGEGTRIDAMLWIACGVGSGVLVLAIMAILGRRWADAELAENPLFMLIQRTVIETSAILRDARYVGTQTAAAVVQVVLVVTAFTLAMPASGAAVSDPLMASALVLGISSLAAFVLPPTMAAGPAAASILVLPMFGVNEAGAMAYAGTYWLVAHTPAMIMGLPALWARR
jgi:hypothetical protein